ncbi:hypothetical protein JTE90_005129 [Oedothorax gibbosus]|uniref:Uncharacterized protein n=1 Tax=Oedothorax gibbosus TaxID=931172 RepID=A0AAV6UNJ5_9ARAC|nr:hypothetical protein JTE90_005129 [Oedothorax gibbosus]
MSILLLQNCFDSPHAVQFFLTFFIHHLQTTSSLRSRFTMNRLLLQNLGDSPVLIHLLDSPSTDFFHCMLNHCTASSLCVSFFTLSCLVTADDQDGSASLLYCDDDIRNFSLASGTDSLLMSGIKRPLVVDYHMKSKVFFWIDSNSNINKAPLWQEGARPSVLRRGVISYGLAVDWIHNLIYWTDHSIGVSRLDGSMARTVLKEEGTNPQAIVLNPAEGFMFCLAIDLDIQSIFWVDYTLNYLHSCKFDGNHRKVLIAKITNPTSIDIYGQHVYFVTQGKGYEALHKLSKVDGSGWTKVFDGKRSLRSLKIFDPSKQLEGYDVCGDDNGGCSHLCLPTSGHTFSCACPNDLNMSSDNHTCLNSDGSPATTPSSTTNAPPSQLPFTVFQTNFPSNTGNYN